MMCWPRRLVGERTSPVPSETRSQAAREVGGGLFQCGSPASCLPRHGCVGKHVSMDEYF